VIRLFRRLFGRPVKYHVVQRDPTRLTIEEWRSNQDAVRVAIQVMQDPKVRQMLDVLRNSSPHRRFSEPGSAEQKAFLMCMCNGYNSALTDFEALARYEEMKEPLEATFGQQEDAA
jgi:hypothetical protein